jgi:hypothetical protein
MTIAFAKARGFAHSVRAGKYHYYWRCEHCNDRGLRVETRGTANVQARKHNDETDHTGPPGGLTQGDQDAHPRPED